MVNHLVTRTVGVSVIGTWGVVRTSVRSFYGTLGHGGVQSVSTNFVQDMNEPFGFRCFHCLALEVPIMVAGGLRFFSRRGGCLLTYAFVLFVVWGCSVVCRGYCLLARVFFWLCMCGWPGICRTSQVRSTPPGGVTSFGVVCGGTTWGLQLGPD